MVAFSQFLTIGAIGISLSLDTFSVSAAAGTKSKNRSLKLAIFLGILFGAFHVIMPLAGYFAGEAARQMINNIDHWIAFGLLAYIGGKMVAESLFSKGDDKDSIGGSLSIRKEWKTYLSLAIATSIDALAIGATIAFLKLPIVESSLIIGGITAIMSFSGVYLGRFFGESLKRKAGILGGLVLVAIGLKILVEHLLFS